MKSEPTVIIEAVRALLIVVATFGIAINASQQSAIVVAVGAFAALVSAGLAWFNRNKVYSPATVQAKVNEAAATGNTNIGNPPRGEV